LATLRKEASLGGFNLNQALASLCDKEGGIRQSAIKTPFRVDTAVHKKNTLIDRPIGIMMVQWHRPPSKRLDGKRRVSDGISSEGFDLADHERGLK